MNKNIPEFKVGDRVKRIGFPALGVGEIQSILFDEMRTVLFRVHFVDTALYHNLSAEELERVEEAPEHDNVNNPAHCCREGAMECIDEMVLIFGKEATAHFCLLNAWKYRTRAINKNGVEDLKKSDWYVKKYKELTNQSRIELTPKEVSE